MKNAIDRTTSAGRRDRLRGPAGLALAALLPALAAAQPTIALHPDDLPVITVSPGVRLQELTGRSAVPAGRSDQASVAYFRLEPGRASAWSHNKVGEESFFVLKGRGEVWVDSRAHPVRPGSFILIPAKAVRSIRASAGEPLEFYAITTPAWSSDDDVLVGRRQGRRSRFELQRNRPTSDWRSAENCAR